MGSIFEQEVNVLRLSAPTHDSMIPLTHSLSEEPLSCQPSASGDEMVSGDSETLDVGPCLPCLSVLSRYLSLEITNLLGKILVFLK